MSFKVHCVLVIYLSADYPICLSDNRTTAAAGNERRGLPSICWGLLGATVSKSFMNWYNRAQLF